LGEVPALQGGVPSRYGGVVHKSQINKEICMSGENVEESLLSREEKEIIVKIFESTEFEYPIDEILEELKNNGYLDVGKMILDAIYDNFLDISSIDNDGTVYIALGIEGEDMWRELKGDEEENEGE